MAYKDIFPKVVFDIIESKTKKEIQGFAEHFKNNNEKICYIAELNGKIIGLMGGSIKSNYEHFSNEYADLTALYIHPDYQNKGIGSKFKEIFIDWAKKNDAKKFVIGVLKDNANARQVYETWGGELNDYSHLWNEQGVEVEEVFYTYDI